MDAVIFRAPCGGVVLQRCALDGVSQLCSRLGVYYSGSPATWRSFARAHFSVEFSEVVSDGNVVCFQVHPDMTDCVGIC